MSHRWRVFALLCVCPCLACPAGESSPSSNAGSTKQAAPQEPAPQKPAPQKPAPQEPAPQEPAPQEPAPSLPIDEPLAAALFELSKQPGWLVEPADAIHTKLELGKAFELHRYSEGMGTNERVGFLVRTQPTTILSAADFAKALGLQAAAYEEVPITDRNRNRLANAGETPFEWQGLQLEVELQPREGGGLGLSGWQVDEVLVLPGIPEPQPVDITNITITPDEAAAAGLPKIGISLDTTNSGMSGTKLGPGEYLHLSGPPGGPLILRIGRARSSSLFTNVVAADHLGDAKLVEEQVELLGAPRRAAAWVNGESLARTSWCAVILAAADAKQEDPAIVLEVGVGHSGDAVACKTALEDPNIKPVLASLKLTGF